MLIGYSIKEYIQRAMFIVSRICLYKISIEKLQENQFLDVYVIFLYC
jgi:hypothetical protein